MIGMTGDARKCCRQIHAMSTARAIWAQRRGSGQGTGRAGLYGDGTWRTAARPGGRWRNQEGSLNLISPGKRQLSQMISGRPQQDSNLRTRLRRPLLYPLSYGGWRSPRGYSLRAEHTLPVLGQS